MLLLAGRFASRPFEDSLNDKSFIEESIQLMILSRLFQFSTLSHYSSIVIKFFKICVQFRSFHFLREFIKSV